MTPPRMTLDEFIGRLHCLRGPWWNTTHMPTMLRAYGGCYSCPITAVALVETGELFLTNDWSQAAKAIGLSHQQAKEIVIAADGRSSPLRQRLIEAVRG